MFLSPLLHFLQLRYPVAQIFDFEFDLGLGHGETPFRRGANIGQLSDTVTCVYAIAHAQASFSSMDAFELLRPPSKSDLGGIEIALGINRDPVHPFELPRHSPGTTP
jgi:hypothetical protein